LESGLRSDAGRVLGGASGAAGHLRAHVPTSPSLAVGGSPYNHSPVVAAADLETEGDLEVEAAVGGTGAVGAAGYAVGLAEEGRT
jgi:hypothetical protein